MNHPDGGKTVATSNGDTLEYNASGELVSIVTRSGTHAIFGADGKVSSIHTKKGMIINHGADASRRVITVRSDGFRVVSTGAHRGYVERPFTGTDGQTYLGRTYVINGHTSTYVYARHRYHEVYYYRYVPAYYYERGFYGWAYSPWASPVAWGWGWAAAPWYRYYGYYFAPSPSYAGPDSWLTDYILAENLQAAYDNVGPTDAATEGSENGLVFTPLLVEGKQSFAPRFSAVGNFAFADHGISLNAAATASYSFEVSEGRRLTVAYGIPAGGYLNGVPAEISVNGVTIASIDKEPDYGWGKITPKQRLLWHRSFPAGRYTVTIRSGGAYVNFYGLWLGSSSVGAPPPDQPPASDANGNQNATPLTPEIKAAIADEVKAQLAVEQKASIIGSMSSAPAGDQLPPALDPKHFTFIVSTVLLEQITGGKQCWLSPGDILTRTGSTPDANQNVTALVASSQKNDCASGSNLTISVQDLQDMHNNFVEEMDAGLQILSNNQGQNGMPASPDAGRRANPEGQAQPYLTAILDLQQQQQEIDQTERDVQRAIASSTQGHD